MRHEHEDGLKLKDWARMLPGVSHRQLVRAAADGRLTCHASRRGSMAEESEQGVGLGLAITASWLGPWPGS